MQSAQGKTPDIGGCLYTYMNLMYSISWSISKFFTSMYVYEFCCFTRYLRKSFDIGGQRALEWSLLRISYPISKFFTSISKSWLRYRMWQRASSSRYRTLYRSFSLRHRSYDFDIEVYEYPISWNLWKMTSISKSKTSISKSKLCFWYWINPYHAEGPD